MVERNQARLQIIIHGDNAHADQEVAVVHVQLHVEAPGLGGAGYKVSESNLQQ